MLTVCKCVCVYMCVHACVSPAWREVAKDIWTERQREKDGVDGDEGAEKGNQAGGTEIEGQQLPSQGPGRALVLKEFKTHTEMGNEILKGQRWAQPRGSKGEAHLQQQQDLSGLSCLFPDSRLNVLC